MTVPLKTRDGRTLAVPAWALVVLVAVVILVASLGVLGSHVFLRSTVVLQFPVIFTWASVAGAAALLFWIMRKGSTPASRSRPLVLRVLQVGAAIGICGVAFGGTVAFTWMLVLQQQVRLAAGTPVEFTTRILGAGRARGCARTIDFANEPLQREASVCATDFPVRTTQPGTFILVSEKIGPLGGHVTSIRTASGPAH